MRGMERLAGESQGALDVFSDEWFRLIQDLHPGAQVRYLIVTAERASGVVYAPVSNFSRSLLAEFQPEYGTGDLVGKIRQEYILPATLEGPIRDLWAAARADPSVLPRHYLLVRPIRDERDSGGETLAVFGPNGARHVELATTLASSFEEQLQQTSRWLARPGLDKLLGAAKAATGTAVFPHLLLRLESSFAASGSMRTRRLDLVQLGLVLSEARDIDEASAAICLSACRTSGIAAFAVLYEKERYYERAARQSVTASAVKVGPMTEIRDQVKALAALDLPDVFNIPLVDQRRSDPTLLEPAKPSDSNEMSWYRMPWLDLRSLSDTLLWKVGSKDFELAALMRATVSHLRQVHWRTAATESHDRPKEAIMATVLLAAKATEHFYDEARKTKERVENEFPILKSSAVSFFRKEQLATINRLMRRVESGSPLTVHLQWHGRAAWRGEIRLPEQNLRELAATVAGTALSGRYRRLRAVSVHADAHFGNLLVDASIPEDPLIISIDPKPLITTAGAEFSEEIKSVNIDAGALDLSLRSLLFDPLYDLAKCVMATSGLHGPIIRGALELGAADQDRFTLANPRDGVRHLTDTGGMSSSKLIRVGTQVPKNCLRDHDTCARALLREVEEAITADAGRPGTDEEARFGVNVGLIRLWGLSLRGLFSAAADRFPSDMATGVALYIIAATYLDIGTKIVIDALGRYSLSDERATTLLKEPFRWYRAGLDV